MWVYDGGRSAVALGRDIYNKIIIKPSRFDYVGTY